MSNRNFGLVVLGFSLLLSLSGAGIPKLYAASITYIGIYQPLIFINRYSTVPPNIHLVDPKRGERGEAFQRISEEATPHDLLRVETCA